MLQHRILYAVLVSAALMGGGASADAAVQEPRAKIAVFITLPVREGFADATEGQVDSSRDLADRISGMSEFSIVDSEKAADLVLVVIGRGVGSEALGAITNVATVGKNVIASTTPVFQNDYWVQVLLEAGPKYRKLLTGSASNRTRASMGAWSDCVLAVAKDLRAWAKVNAVQIAALKAMSAGGDWSALDRPSFTSGNSKKTVCLALWCW